MLVGQNLLVVNMIFKSAMMNLMSHLSLLTFLHIFPSSVKRIFLCIDKQFEKIALK